MKTTLKIMVLLLLPSGIRGDSTTVDIFPLRPGLHYQYNYERTHAGNEPKVSVSGIVDLIIHNYFTANATLRIWEVEERHQLSHEIIGGFYSDTLIIPQNDTIFFNISESISGNHLITIPSVIIFEDHIYGSIGWATHSPWSNLSVERFTHFDSLNQIKKGGLGVFYYDSLMYFKSVGLTNRIWKNEWVGTSFWIDTLKVSQIGEPIVGISYESKMPNKFLLNQNYPNPFNPNTKIKYAFPASLNPSEGGTLVSLKIYDLLGREVATLVNEVKPIGIYEIEFNGSSLPSGVYFYQLRVSALQSKDGKTNDPESSSGQGFVETKKMILLR